MAALYLVLIAGSITMVYPFLMMISTGMKGPTDQNDNRLVPAFLSDEFEMFRKFVDDKYSGNPERIALIYGDAASFQLISTSPPDEVVQVNVLADSEYVRYETFLKSLAPDEWEAGFRDAQGRWGSRLSSLYQDFLRKQYGSVDAVNRAYLEQHVVFQTIQPPVERFEVNRWEPKPGAKWSDWLRFRETLPLYFRIPITVRGMYQAFFRSKYKNRIQAVPSDVRGNAMDFCDLEPAIGSRAFREFEAGALPDRYRFHSADEKWLEAGGTGAPPIAEYESSFVRRNLAELRRDYSARNYDQVLDYVLLHGRAVWNTALFCFLAVATQLIVNPLAAYALSRYPMKMTGKILLFLLAAMAFPAEVTMIPSFLLLRDLGLLNTFAALVLPTAASGYTIYLLKGFFDSQPRELFESGAMDGAKEWQMFRKIAIPLSKPVLAVAALGAFAGAYGAFMYAFVVAQDQRMWTLMVWVYQLQARAPKATTMAALTLAALPTVVVFLFAQRVILRGIILPGEK